MDSNPHYCIFFTSDVYYKEIKKTNSIHLEILKEGDAMVVIRECANINIKIEEKEEKQDMCKAIDDMMRDARMSGEALGEARGEAERKRMQNQLVEKQNQLDEKQNQLDEKQNQLDEKQNRLDKYEKEIEELKKQLAERQPA